MGSGGITGPSRLTLSPTASTETTGRGHAGLSFRPAPAGVRTRESERETRAYLVAPDPMLLFKLLPVFQPPHGGRRVPPGRTAELDRVGGGHGVKPLLHLFRAGPVRSSCLETTAQGGWTDGLTSLAKLLVEKIVLFCMRTFPRPRGTTDLRKVFRPLTQLEVPGGGLLVGLGLLTGGNLFEEPALP